MNRREFVSLLGSPFAVQAPRDMPGGERVEALTPGPKPLIALNHLGFVPEATKRVLVRLGGNNAPGQFHIREIGSSRFGWHGAPPFQPQLRPLVPARCDFGPCLVGDFSEVRQEGLYQVTIPEERSVPFFIRADVWRRTLAKALDYIHAQRCGTEVAGVHPACHLDDARLRSTGEHRDVTGGWHDAGDLRKWMSATMMNGFALLEVLAAGLAAPSWGREALCDEFRWGNRYFLKMQDTDGLVFNDTAGGINGDNSDNHWTDNRVGTADDRYINPVKPGRVQAMFIALEARAATIFGELDREYATQCRQAAQRCWQAATPSRQTGDLVWWIRAASALAQATGEESYGRAAREWARNLVALQYEEFPGGQRQVRGFWRNGPEDSTPYVDAVHSAHPALVLLELVEAWPRDPEASRWRDSAALYLEEYLTPMVRRNAYQIVPFGVFFGSPTPETYRPLEGELTYRYFMPVRKQSWWIGTSSHLLGHAALLAQAARVFGKAAYRDLAYRQLEWIMGANPFGACLMTAEGMRNPYPHSRFVGLIPGGIMNGIAGNQQDEPVLDTENGFDWRTTEYWSPHNAHYIWTLVQLAR